VKEKQRPGEVGVVDEEDVRVTARLLSDLPIIDLTIEDPPIEDVIERVFADPRDEKALG